MMNFNDSSLYIKGLNDTYVVRNGHVYKNGVLTSMTQDDLLDELTKIFKIRSKHATNFSDINARLNNLLFSELSDVESKTELPEGTFTKSAQEIVDILKEYARDKGHAVKMINFYINRAGDKLSNADEVMKAKEMLEGSEDFSTNPIKRQLNKIMQLKPGDSIKYDVDGNITEYTVVNVDDTSSSPRILVKNNTGNVKYIENDDLQWVSFSTNDESN